MHGLTLTIVYFLSSWRPFTLLTRLISRSASVRPSWSSSFGATIILLEYIEASCLADQVHQPFGIGETGVVFLFWNDRRRQSCRLDIDQLRRGAGMVDEQLELELRASRDRIGDVGDVGEGVGGHVATLMSALLG